MANAILRPCPPPTQPQFGLGRAPVTLFDALLVLGSSTRTVGVGLGVGTPEGTSQTSRAIAAMGRVSRALIELRRSHGSRNTADSGRGLWTRAPKLLDTNLILPHVASRSAVSLFSGFMLRIGNDPVRHPPVRRTRGLSSEEECAAGSR